MNEKKEKKIDFNFKGIEAIRNV